MKALATGYDGQLRYVDNSCGINHMIKPLPDGHHPVYSHLVMAEIEEHYGNYILTIQGQEGDALLSEEDARHIFGSQFDDEFGYISSEYIDMLEEQNDKR